MNPQTLCTGMGSYLMCCSIGSGSKRGLCTFTCFNIREHYGEELRGVANMGMAREETIT